MARTLTDDDIEAIADKVVMRLAERLASKSTPAQNAKVTPPAPAPAVEPLAYTKEELAERLKMSPVTIWRLEKRGLLRPVQGFRHKIYSQKEVRRFLDRQAMDG